MLALQGTAAYSNYGYKSNEELILGYGFMLEDNPANFFHVSLGLVARTEQGGLSFPLETSTRGIQTSDMMRALHRVHILGCLPTCTTMKPMPGTLQHALSRSHEKLQGLASVLVLPGQQD